MIGLVLAAGMTLASQDGVATCAKIADDRERLSCYDAAVGRMAPVRAEPLAPLDPSAPATTPEGVARFGLLDRPDEPEAVTGVVASLEFDGDGRATVTLTDGQVWRQLASDRVKIVRRSGFGEQTAIVKKAALGSFRMSLEPLGMTIRVRRLE